MKRLMRFNYAILRERRDGKGCRIESRTRININIACQTCQYLIWWIIVNSVVQRPAFVSTEKYTYIYLINQQKIFTMQIVIIQIIYIYKIQYCKIIQFKWKKYATQIKK